MGRFTTKICICKGMIERNLEVAIVIERKMSAKIICLLEDMWMGDKYFEGGKVAEMMSPIEDKNNSDIK